MSRLGLLLGGNKAQMLSLQAEATSKSEYECFPVECKCGAHVGYVINPEYSFEVGKSEGIPTELIFTEKEAVLKKAGTFSTDSRFITHPNNSGDAFEVMCSCGKPYHFFLEKRSGKVRVPHRIITQCSVNVIKVHIPSNRICYVTEAPL